MYLLRSTLSYKNDWIDANGCQAESQNQNPNHLYQLDLSQEEWYAFNDN